MEVNEKELQVPPSESGWSKIQAGMGQKQEEEVGRERRAIQQGGGRLGREGLSVEYSASNTGVTMP